MIICDKCSMPVEEGNVEVRPLLGDPLGSEHWCRECNDAFNRIYFEEKGELISVIMSRTEVRFKAWLKDRFK